MPKFNKKQSNQGQKILYQRKEARKNARKLKKQKKHEFNLARRTGGPFIASSDQFTKKDRRFDVDDDADSGGDSDHRSKKVQKIRKDNIVSKKPAENDKQMHRVAIKQEDKIIKSMEKKLKLNKRRKKDTLPQSFYDEGLGDVLDFVDKRNPNDEDEGPAVKKPKKSDQSDQLPFSEDEMSEGEFEREFGGLESDEDETDQDDVIGEDSEQDLNQEDSSDNEAEEASDLDENFDESELSNPDESDQEELREDIYGRKIDKHGNLIESERPKVKLEKANYTPEELNPDLLRRIRGQLNRVTSSNLPGISSFLETLYKSNSFYQMNEGICKCVRDLIVIDVTLSPLKLVEELCLLMATLHENIGEEVGGHAVHYFVKLFHDLLTEQSSKKLDQDSKQLDQSSKQLDNSVAILCFMHAAGLLDPSLMFDIIEELVKVFDEKCIELIVFTLISNGFLLRKESPARMKELIAKTKEKASSINKDDIAGDKRIDIAGGKRIEYMIETLTLVKNNNLMKISSRSGVVSPIERENLRNVLKNCLKRSTKVNYIPGRFEQVLLSNRWWIKVGTLIELTDSLKNEKKNELKLTNEDEFTELDERLCRMLRLDTTPLRRSLFKSLISSSDYIEACQRLTTLAKKQFNEVSNVVIHVGLNEKNFNPFYVHLLNALATFDRKYKLSIQFALRDKITQLETLNLKSRNNLPKLLFNLIKENVVSINVLKVIEFTDLTNDYVQLLKTVLEGIFGQDDTTIKTVLEKIPKKDPFASAIKLFISLYMDKSMSEKSKDMIKTRLRIRDLKDFD